MGQFISSSVGPTRNGQGLSSSHPAQGEGAAYAPVTISAKQLFNLQADFRCNLLIIDCRTCPVSNAHTIERQENTRIADVYAQSHIDGAVRYQLVEARLSARCGSVSACGDNYNLRLDRLDLIVLYSDTNSADGQKVQHQQSEGIDTEMSLALQLRNSKQKNVVAARANILHLDCGFGEYQSRYPFMCTDHPTYCAGMLYPSHVADRVFLGNMGVSTNVPVLRNLGVTHVVNCTVECPYADELNWEIQNNMNTGGVGFEVGAAVRTDDIPYRVAFRKLRVPVVDDTDAKIENYFEEAIAFIQAALVLPNTVVLVHCKHGQSRSATVLAAWLMIHGDAETKLAIAAGSQPVIRPVSPSSSSSASEMFDPSSDKLSPVEATIRYLQSCRPRVHPNAGFREKLELWGQKNGLMMLENEQNSDVSNREAARDNGDQDSS
jgi:hypothetical protein